MSAPVEVPMSAMQRELWNALMTDLRRSQSNVSLFCDTLFRAQGVTGVQNVQMLDGKLVGEIPDAPKVDA